MIFNFKIIIISYSKISKISYFRMGPPKQLPAYQQDQSLPISLVTLTTPIVTKSHKLPLRDRVICTCLEELCLDAADQNHFSLNSQEEPKGLM